MIKEYQTSFIFLFSFLYSTGESSDTVRTPRCARGLAKGEKMSDVIDEKKKCRSLPHRRDDAVGSTVRIQGKGEKK